MYVIYEKNSAQLSFFEDEGEDIVDLNEAEELLRLPRKDDPREFERISELRDGIRAAKVSTDKGLYVFCQAGRYQQLFLVDEKGEVVSRDIPRVLGVIKAGPEEKSLALPPGFNAAVMRVKRVFAEEARHREADASTPSRYLTAKGMCCGSCASCSELHRTRMRRHRLTSWRRRFVAP